MSELWGVPDKWATSIDGSDEQIMRHREAQIQELGANTDHLRASSDHLRAQIPGEALKQKAELIKQKREGLQLQMMERRMAVMAQRAGQQGAAADSIEQQMTEMAQDELAMGNPDKAAHIYNEIAGVKQKGAQAKVAEAKLKDAERERELKKREGMYEIFSGINGPQDYDTAIKLLREKYPDEDIPKSLQQYNPQTVEVMKRITKNGLEQAKAKAAKEREDDVDRRHRETLAATRRNLEFREGKDDARHADTERRLTANKKVGGAKITAPGNPDNKMVMAADAMVRRDYPQLARDIPLGKDFASSAAYDIASEAKAMMAANRGLSGSQAMARVYARMKQAGSFSTETKKGTSIGPIPITKDERKDTYTPKAPPAAAKAIPPPAKGQPFDPKAIYDPGDGSHWRFDPEKKKLISVD